MNQTNDKLKEIHMRTEQLKNQRKLKERRQQEIKRKIDTCRNIVIGELVCQYFPSAMQYQPRHSKAENKVEFAEFENTLRWLSEHIELLNNMRNNSPKEY